MSFARLLLSIAVICSFSWAQAEELNPPILLEQTFESSATAPQTLAETRLQTFSFSFISADLIPGQEVIMQLAPEIPAPLHITRDDSGKLNVKFDDRFPADLRNVSLEEQPDDYLELKINNWNTAAYPYSLVMAQTLSKTGSSVILRFSNPNYALIKIQSDKNLAQWLSKSDEMHSFTEWYGFLFNELSLQEYQKLVLTVSCKRIVNGTVFTEPILTLPATAYSSEIANALDAEITHWLQNEAINKADVTFTMDLTIYEQADDLEIPVYTINGLDLNGSNVR